MDRSAIEKLEELAVTAENRVNDNCYFEVAALPSGMDVHSLEKYQTHRNRFRAKFKTKTLQDFIDYVKNNSGNMIFIDKERMSAECTFDMADLGHCEHTATLALEETPEMKALGGVNGARSSQQDQAEFLEDWRHNIEAIDAEGKDMPIADAISAIRHITMEHKNRVDHSVQSLSKAKSGMESIEAKSNDKPLPAWIAFNCKPYEGFSDRSFMLRLSVSFGRDTPSLTYRLQNQDKHDDEIATEMGDKIKVGNKDATVYLGTINLS